MDESTSALDTRNERLLYRALREAGKRKESNSTGLW
jgi:ABC-type multidrug transport system fused ATPase/permease subunit